MLKNTKTSWGLGAQVLHWLVFVIFSGMLLAGEVMVDLDKADSFIGFGKYEIYGLHKSFGIILLFIVFARISWRMLNVTPETAPATSKEKLAAHIAHYMLYLVMLVMPISGYTMSMAGGHGITLFSNPDWKLPNLIGLDKEIGHWAHEIHGYCVYVVYVLLAAHIIAALYHHFIRKDNVLNAMLPWKK